MPLDNRGLISETARARGFEASRLFIFSNSVPGKVNPTALKQNEGIKR